MMKSPLVTIMMPVYNGEKTIEIAIRSLLLQTYDNWLCIIVNDGSTDGTSEVLRKYETESKFKVITLKKNCGRATARQLALDNALGEYIGYLDADDFYHPRKLEKQVDYLERNPDIKLISCGQGSFDNEYKLRAVRGLNGGYETLYKLNKVYGGSYAGSLLRLTEAKKISYNLSLKSSEDDHYFRKYLDSKLYAVLNEVLYYHAEIGFTSSKKILAYQFGALKSELSLPGKGLHSFYKFFLRLGKMFIYLAGLPLLGAEYFLKLRGTAPDSEERKEFGNTKQQLFLTKVNNLQKSW